MAGERLLCHGLERLYASVDGRIDRRHGEPAGESAGVAVSSFMCGVGRRRINVRRPLPVGSKRAAKDLLDLTLIRPPWVGQATRIFERIGRQQGNVLQLGAQLPQSGGNFNVMGQAANGGDGGLGALFVGDALDVGTQRKAHVAQAFGADAGVEALHMGQQHRVAHAVRQVVETAQLVGHGVHETQRRIVEGHAGKELRIRHVFPRDLVAAVAYREAQVGADQFNGLDGAGVGDRCGGGGHVGFDGMGQCIHAGGGGEALGHADHQAWVVDRQQRRDVAVDDGHFHVAGFVGDDAEAGHLTGGAGGGVDGHQWQLWLAGQVDAFVVADMPAVGSAQGDALGAVMGRAAAQGDHKIALALLQQRQAFFDVVHIGVGLGAVIDHRVDVLHRQFLGDHAGHTGLGQARVGDDQRFAKAIVADGDHGFVEAVGAHDVNGGDEEGAAHGESSDDVYAYSIHLTCLRHLDQDQRQPVIKSPSSRFRVDPPQ
ncbi:hypothetical protein ALQ38_05530 [Pseudomonas marginalis pv. marginalis]|nr:hypothetical protein ALQ38_05530 [Pseudomonas marginalis pv. marginalis]